MRAFLGAWVGSPAKSSVACGILAAVVALGCGGYRTQDNDGGSATGGGGGGKAGATGSGGGKTDRKSVV